MPKYYDIREDLATYPGAWCLLIYSKRGPGKTYSTLRYMIEEGKKFVFIKRTVEDVSLLCAGSGKIGSKPNAFGVDLSPFKPLNRDFGWGIKAFLIKDGLGGFWRTKLDEDGNPYPVGDPVGYILAASVSSKFKGFDMSECDYMIFDEFIPRIWDRTFKGEGDQIMDMYETISRDRVKRGRGELIFIGLANAVNISNPLFLTLEVVDHAAEMNAKMDIESTEDQFLYLEYRGILLHQINKKADEEEAVIKTGIQRAMEDTAWGDMAYGGKFAYNDFSNVKKVRLKGFHPVVAFRYKHKTFYVYSNSDGIYAASLSRNDKCKVFNLELDNDQKAFYSEYVLELRRRCIDGKMTFETYTAYDIIVNYKMYFKI